MLETRHFLKCWKSVPRLPVVVLLIAAVFICFYIQANKKRASHDTATPRTQAATSSVVQTIPLGEGQADINIHCDRSPPRYSEVDHPPPYSLVREIYVYRHENNVFTSFIYLFYFFHAV